MSVLTGDKELKQQLTKLKNKVSKQAIRKGTRQGAKIIQAKAKELAPQKSGQLKKGIKVRSMPRSRKYVGTMVRLADTGQVFYGAFLNYGTKYIHARRFLNAAARDKKTEASNVATQIIAEEIDRGMQA